MANEVSKIKLPNDTTEYPLQDDQAIASITRSGTTFTATRRDGTSFTFTQQDNNTTYTFATGDNNGQIKVTPNGGTAQNVSVKGLGAAAYKGTTTSVTSGSSDLVTSGAVYTAIDNLPEPMIFKGSLGTGGTITTLPTVSSANEGYTYKVITAGTYASQPAKVGDLFISNGTDWIWIPSGDEPSGTVTSITLKATSPIAIDSSSAITTSGTRTLSHANSGVTAGTYRSVTVNATGHVTAGTNPTTLSGYGITDAKIANGVITLGSNTITPLTSHQTVTDNNPTLAWGTKSKVATIGSTAINVTMPSNPNTDTKVTAVGNHYAPAEDSTAQLDADASSTTAATWNSTSLVTGITVKRDAKGHVTGIAVDSIKMPANPNTNTTYTIGTSGNNITLTPSSGSAQSITVPYATDAGYLRDSVTATAKLRYINSNDATTWTADTLAATDSIAVIRNSVTGAWATGHIVTFNVNTVGTPFQLGVHDSSELYFYKRYKSSGTYGDWVKMNAGYADSAGSATKATQDGSGNTITSTYVKKSGDTMTGALYIKGSAASKPLHVRGICGMNEVDGSLVDDTLYLQYGNTTTDEVRIGNTGGGRITDNGMQYNGNAATATKATQDSDGNTIKSTYLKLSGGTLTGTVYSTNNIWTKRTGYTVDTSSNNNCTTSVEGDFGFVDNNGYWSSRVANTNDTAGKTNIYLQVRNKKTDGTEVTNQLQLGVTKAGARTVTVSDASIWRSALGLGTTTASGTTGRIAYYSGANAISSSGGLKYYTANSTATSPAVQTVLEVFGQTYGNDAAYLKSGTAGVLSYGDGSPQIRMSASENGGQNGALMFTDHDTAGTGASFHFVSDQSDWNVTSKRFHARTGISIGTDLPKNWNGLQVQGINQNWLNVGKSPVIYMKKSDGGASGALGMDTKTGRVVIATYPANDDLLYFNWYSDETLAGTVNQYDAQMKWTPSTNTLSTNISGNASTISNFRVSTTSSLGIAVAYNAIGYVSGLTSSLWNYNRSDGALYTQRYNDKYQHEIYADYRTGRMSVRGHNNGTWEEWKRVIVDEVLTNQDLDDVTIPGFYRGTGDNTSANKPSGVTSFGMLVIHAAGGSYYYQLLNQSGTNNTWRRSCSNGTWSAWVAENINNTDVNVKVNNTNPTTGTWYYPVWYTATSGTGNVNANDGFRHYSLQGTASAVGRSIIALGNNTNSGTAGNKRGELFLYSEKSGRAEIVYTAAATATVVHTFPATAGTILNTGTTSFTQSLSSGTKIGTIKINGTSTDLYCQTNTNTHRPIQVNGTEILGNNTTALNLNAGSNITLTNSSGTVTIAGTANNAVTQTVTTTDAEYDILFSASTSGTTTKVEGAKKSEKLTFNPSTQTLRVGDYATGDHIINIGGSTILNGSWGESDGILSLYGKYYEAIHIYQTSSSGGDSYIQSHHNLNMGTHRISNGTISSMTYTEPVTNTTGYIMHGRDTSQQYSCQWASSKLNFYVGTTNIGNISDRQLKSEIDDVDPRLMEAIAECKIYQYKAFNRDGLISVGIMAQDLVEKCEEKGVRPENYELLTKMNFIQDDDTLYYSVDYNQYATFMIDYLQKKVKELEEKIK